MSDAVIVLNAGSSSLKFSIYAVDDSQLNLKARGQLEGLGTTPRFKAKNHDGKVVAEFTVEKPARDFGHPEAFALLSEWIRKQFSHELSPVAVGHRIAHGGSEFAEPVLVDEKVIARLEKLVPLVPLHQPHNLAAIRAVSRLRPDIPQIACFDTAFHHGRERVTERFGLPDELYRQGVRRWGFHGLSYQFISMQIRKIAPDVTAGRVVVAHLGSGASLCAMRNGRSVDTTMSFSALDGLPMGTRCGSLDPGVILYLLREGWNADRIEETLYKKSGLLGISTISNDVRDLLNSDHPLAAEAIGFFVYRVVREIAAMTAALGGLDALVFTAGIGENAPTLRERIGQGLAWLGVRIDPEANLRNNQCISPSGRAPSVWVIPTDEEVVIAEGALKVLRASAKEALRRPRTNGMEGKSRHGKPGHPP